MPFCLMRGRVFELFGRSSGWLVIVSLSLAELFGRVVERLWGRLFVLRPSAHEIRGKKSNSIYRSTLSLFLAQP
jgi:hypothetical protein